MDRRLDLDVQHGMRTALDRLRERTAAKAGVPLTSCFLVGAVVPALQDHVETRGVDLVVMTTHGRGGVSRAWLGSIADALVRHLHVPVLLGRQRAIGGGADAPAFRRMLVPLDGSAFAEDVLAHAVALGVSTQTEYLLVRVVPPFPMLPVLYPNGAIPVHAGAVDDLEREAERYLATVAEQVRSAGGTVSTRVVVHRQPAHAILESARGWSADLLALASHGYGALGTLRARQRGRQGHPRCDHADARLPVEGATARRVRRGCVTPDDDVRREGNRRSGRRLRWVPSPNPQRAFSRRAYHQPAR